MLAGLDALPSRLDAADAFVAARELAMLDRATGAVRPRAALALLDGAFDALVAGWQARPRVLGDEDFETAAAALESAHDALTAAAERQASAKRPPVAWDQAPLGAVGDTVLAKLFGVTPQAVRSARRARSVTAAPCSYVDWEEMPLGDMPDAALARRTGVTVATVWQARTRRGIAACPPGSRRVDWAQVALGSAPDTAIAEQLGVPVTWVYNERRRRAIAAYLPASRRIDWAAQPLGRVPSAALARALGVSAATVARHCRRLGRDAFRGDVLSQEGEPLHSAYEAMLDAVLHAHGIAHEHQVPVGPGKRTADFRLRSLHVEVVGMVGTPFYDAAQSAKRREYAELCIDVLWMTAAQVSDLYFGQDVRLPLRWRSRPLCPDCGRLTSRTGTCARCWPNGRYGSAACDYCGEPMALNSIAQRFHRQCAARHRRTPRS